MMGFLEFVIRMLSALPWGYLVFFCTRLPGAVIREFGQYGPFWLGCFLVMSTFRVFYRYAWLTLIVPDQTGILLPLTDRPHGKMTGIAIITILGLIRLYWVASWLMALFITNFCDQQWSSVTKGQSIVHARGDPMAVTVWHPDGRPRVCPACDRESSDRVYHEGSTGRDLPIFDHYCSWIKVSVYMRTMKTYLYTLIFLPVDIVFTFVVLIISMSVPEGTVDWVFTITVLFCVPALIVGLALFAPKQWWHLALRNEVAIEYRHSPRSPILLGFKDVADARRPLIRYRFVEDNPWDLGMKGNLCQVLGDAWWKWLLFFWQPERVSMYGRYPFEVDLPYSEAVWRLRGEVLGSQTGRRTPFVTDAGIELADRSGRVRQLHRSDQGPSSSHGGGPAITGGRRRLTRSS